jgi:hypothetical protein
LITKCKYAFFAVFILLLPLDTQAKEHRSNAARHAFVYEHACPDTGLNKLPCHGYIIDHVVPLCAGGDDSPSNMQWQTIAEAKAKDRIERQECMH